MDRGTLIFLIATICVIVSSIVFAFARKVVLGYESYSQYHYIILVLLVSSLVFFMFTTDPLFYLDFTSLSVSVTFIFARMGCVKIGCCYGKVISSKPTSSIERTRDIDSKRFEEVKLFPTQKLEIVMHTINASLVLTLILFKVEHGMPFILAMTSLSFVRFYLEWFRGDADRPIIFRLYETQWLSIIVLSSICALILADQIPNLTLPFFVLVVVIFSSLVSAVNFKNRLRNEELLSILSGYDSLGVNESEVVENQELSNGWNLSYSAKPQKHLSFSNLKKKVNKKQIEVIRTFLNGLGRIPDDMKIEEGKKIGVFHLLEVEK